MFIEIISLILDFWNNFKSKKIIFLKIGYCSHRSVEKGSCLLQLDCNIKAELIVCSSALETILWIIHSIQYTSF